MDEEPEDDVLFDQAGLLSKTVKPMKKITRRVPTSKGSRRLLKTFCLCAAFFGLGICVALPGPTLIDLAHRAQTTAKHIGIIITGRSIGYLVGSMIGGELYDRLNQYLLMVTALFFTGVFTISAPFSRNLVLLVALISVQGFTLGFIDTGGNMICVNLWGQSSGPYMQAMHFSYGIGAFIAPLVANPFLSNITNGNQSFSTTIKPIETKKVMSSKSSETQVAITAATTTSREASTDTSKARKKRDNKPDDPKTSLKTTISTLKATSKPKHTSKHEQFIAYISHFERFQYAFIVVGLILIVVSFLYTAVCCCSQPEGKAIKNQEIGGHVLKQEPTVFRFKVMVMLSFMYFLIIGIQLTYGTLVSSFAIKKFNYDEVKASYVTAVFWGSFAAARLLAIFLARFPAIKILIFDFIVTFLSLLAITFAVEYHDVVLWIFSSTLGIGLATLFPTGMVWAESYIEITGRAASVFVVGSALGEMVVPFVGTVLLAKKPVYLMYLLLALAMVAGVLFLILFKTATGEGVRYRKVGTSMKASRNSNSSSVLEMGGIDNETFTSNSLSTSGASRRIKPGIKSGTKAD